jgi:hypothetical protein
MFGAVPILARGRHTDGKLSVGLSAAGSWRSHDHIMMGQRRQRKLSFCYRIKLVARSAVGLCSHARMNQRWLAKSN